MIGLCQYHLSDGTRYCKSDVLALRIPHIIIDLNRNQLQSRTINTPRWSISSFPRLSSFAYIIGVMLSLGMQQLYWCTYEPKCCVQPPDKTGFWEEVQALSASKIKFMTAIWTFEYCHMNVIPFQHFGLGLGATNAITWQNFRDANISFYCLWTSID